MWGEHLQSSSKITQVFLAFWGDSSSQPTKQPYIVVNPNLNCNGQCLFCLPSYEYSVNPTPFWQPCPPPGRGGKCHGMSISERDHLFFGFDHRARCCGRRPDGPPPPAQRLDQTGSRLDPEALVLRSTALLRRLHRGARGAAKVLRRRQFHLVDNHPGVVKGEFVVVVLLRQLGNAVSEGVQWALDQPRANGTQADTTPHTPRTTQRSLSWALVEGDLVLGEDVRVAEPVEADRTVVPADAERGDPAVGMRQPQPSLRGELERPERAVCV